MVCVPTAQGRVGDGGLPPLKVDGRPEIGAVDGELHRAAVVEGARTGRHRGRECHGLAEVGRVRRGTDGGAGGRLVDDLAAARVPLLPLKLVSPL